MSTEPGSGHFAKLESLFAQPRLDQNGWPYRERLLRRKLALGLFLPNMSGAGGGYFPTDMDSGTTPTFDYNARCAQLVDELEFDFIFPPGRWTGNGGSTSFNEFTLEVVTLTSALAAITKQVFLFTTWHVSYHFHPMHVAKMGATLDHISGGRWGLNVVTGWKEDEALMFGMPFLPRPERYALGAEFVEALKTIWTAKEPATLDGRYFKGTGCIVLPKPVQQPYPLLINAGSSREGISFATQHCDYIFITGGTSREPGDLVDVVKNIRQSAADRGRKVKVVLPVTLICRDTEREALALKQEILDNVDRDAVENMARNMNLGSASWSEVALEPLVLGVEASGYSALLSRQQRHY